MCVVCVCTGCAPYYTAAPKRRAPVGGRKIFVRSVKKAIDAWRNGSGAMLLLVSPSCNQMSAHKALQQVWVRSSDVPSREGNPSAVSFSFVMTGGIDCW
jgi:hypothetical protein